MAPTDPASDDERDSGLGEVTQLLGRIERGESEARGELFELLYPELRRCAQTRMKGQHGSHTLQATALVNEAFLRIAKPRSGGFKNRSHFLMTASRAMRHVLVDHARRKARDKRSGVREEAPVDAIVVEEEGRELEVVALDEALQKLEGLDPAMARAVELRFFCGANVGETSEALGIPRRTFEARWQSTRDWLKAQLA